MIELALGQWLRTTLPDVSTVGIRRANALAKLRTAVDGRIYVGRQPDRTSGMTLTLARVSTTRINTLSEERSCVQTVVSTDLYIRTTNGAERVHDAADALRIAVTGYQGYWSGRWVWDVAQEGDSLLTTIANDGGVDWEYRLSNDYQITWSDVTAL